ncbi:hypothetical protein [Arcobacter vandammei]|uniref:hypothetical protein n=1 Tax=Arcobacter vandammei TaxID=2782243 RepID=UPI0018DFE4C3|nr:hypothetical protein [Arcobacter vandammei]
MSMSQEEIEALMNGLDIVDDDKPEPEVEIEEPVKVDTKEIEELISQTKEIEGIEDTKILSKADEIENLLKDIESTPSFEEKEEEIEELDNFDADLNLDSLVEQENQINEDDIVKNWTSSKINEGIIPTPAQSDTKVVSQLTQVANDSEEKVSKIFDVLSLALDNNGIIRDSFKDCEKSLESQKALLNSLSQKFPNIKVFSEHLENINKMNSSIKNLTNILNEEDNSIFQAMELMQFNDINRQKIERVMFVIRKLSLYLNNLFEDDENSKEIAVAKHIHGDDNDDLAGDDLDKLIEEFSKK